MPSCNFAIISLSSSGYFFLFSSFILLVILLFPSHSVVTAQTASIVNCSHRGTVYNKADHSDDTSSFTCRVCCGWRCCEISKNISLKIIYYTTLTGNTPLEIYLITLKFKHRWPAHIVTTQI